MRGRNLTPVVTRIRSLPVEGPKPHIAVEPVAAAATVIACTRRHPPPNLSYCLSGGRSPAPVVTRCRIRCLPVRGPKPCTHRRHVPPRPSLPVRGPKPYTCRCHPGRCRCRCRCHPVVAAMSDKSMMKLNNEDYEIWKILMLPDRSMPRIRGTGKTKMPALNNWQT